MLTSPGAMRLTVRIIPFLLLSLIAACGGDAPTACCGVGEPALRIVNAFTTPLDVLVDGAVSIPSLAAGSIGTATLASGSHTLVDQPGDVWREVQSRVRHSMQQSADERRAQALVRERAAALARKTLIG